MSTLDADELGLDHVVNAPPAAGKRSPATQLLELIAESVTVYHTPAGDPYADVKIDGHRETYALPSRAAREYLTRAYYMATDRAPRPDAIREALDVLIARARYDGDEIEVALRVAEYKGALYLDLGDPTWSVVEITAAGWRITPVSSVRFRRERSTLALPRPMRGGSLDALRALVRVESDRDWWQLVGWLLAALRPRGPYPVLVLVGEPGAAKSTTARILRGLIDPSVGPLRAEPREGRDLIVAARNGHVIATDNVSRLPPWLSDAYCRLATGGGYSARSLYTDADEIVIDVQRPVIITGIEDVCTRSDLADRALVVTLPPFTDAARRPERELDAAIAAATPGILGALLDAVVVGLRELPGVRLDRLPRMADYAEWVTACEPALGCAPDTMLRAYTAGREAVTETTLEASAVAMALRELMATVPTWTGTATELLAVLTARVGEDIRRDPHRWPRDGRGLRGQLTRMMPMLRADGIVIDYVRATDKKRTRTMHVYRGGGTVQTVRNGQDVDRAADGADGADGGAPTIDSEVFE